MSESGGSETMSPTALLALWEQAHGTLSEEWRNRFLTDERVAWLGGQPQKLVEPAIAKNRYLNDITHEVERAKRKPPPSRGPLRGKRRDSTRGSGEPGFYRMPRAQKPQRSLGQCGACGMAYGLDGRCRC